MIEIRLRGTGELVGFYREPLPKYQRVIRMFKLLPASLDLVSEGESFMHDVGAIDLVVREMRFERGSVLYLAVDSREVLDQLGDRVFCMDDIRFSPK